MEITTQENKAQNQISILDTTVMGAMMMFAEQMAKASFSVPAHLKGNIADCLAITMQAQQWGMNPFAVAQKTHLINGVLGYESQLVNAVISSSTAVQGRFKYEYSNGWDKLAGKVKFAKNGNGKTVPTKAWTDADEATLWVRCGAVLNGDDAITWGEPVYFGNVTTRNSPLWVTAPAQQLSYLALKYWARLYTPDVILGVYDKESLEQPERTEREINPATNDLDSILSGNPPAQPEPAQEAELMPEEKPPAGGVTKFDEIKQYISEVMDAASYEIASEAFNDAAKNKLCNPQELQALYDLLMSKTGN